MSFLGNIYGFRAYYNHSRGKFDKAKLLYEKAYKEGMDNDKFILSYGVINLMESNFEKARDLFSSILVDIGSKEEHKLIAKMNISLAYWKLDKMDLAIEMLEELHIKNRSGKVYGTLGYLLVQSGNLEKALEYNLEALDYDDEDPVILDNLGQVYYKMDKFDLAKEYFIRAEEEKSDQAVTLYHLGLIYTREENHDLAKEKLEKALSCNITPLSAVTHEDINKALDNLDLLDS